MLCPCWTPLCRHLGELYGFCGFSGAPSKRTPAALLDDGHCHQHGLRNCLGPLCFWVCTCYLISSSGLVGRMSFLDHVRISKNKKLRWIQFG